LKKIGAAIVAAISALVVVANIPEGVTPTTQIIEVSGGQAVFNIESSGDDRGLIVVAGYALAEGVSVVSATVGGQAMTMSAQGFLSGVGVMETWTATGFSTGTLPVTVTLSSDFDAILGAVLLTDLDQTTPLHSSTTSIGQSVANSLIICPGGDATLAVIMSLPFTPTVSTPSGFTELGTDTGTQARLTVLLDDDSDADSFNLAMSTPCHWGILALGLNVAP